MNQPDYHHFYPKSLIPIGVKDKIALFSLQNLNDEDFQATHWLVALHAKSISESIDENELWQVLLYPADIEGSYTWQRPYFVSNLLQSMDEAFEISSLLETYGRDDTIISSNLQEKIS